MSEIKKAVSDAGGASLVAEACGVSVRAVYKWLASESLPRTEYTGETSYAKRIAELAEGRGNAIDVARLLIAAAPKRFVA